jgi:1,4-alpha-glucan branching enzyme
MNIVHGRVGRSSNMGATVDGGGCGVRVWAPNAEKVALVTGDDLRSAAAQGWQPPDATKLEALGDGSWGGFAPGLGEGMPYMFHVQGTGSSGLKRDPFARDLTLHPVFPQAFCLVRDPANYPWHDGGWHPPAFRDLIIYQLHVGTWWAQDANGRDVRKARGGTFLDVAAKLGHLKTLGVTAVQLLPVQEFETQFSLGYNGVDYFSPETQYVVGQEDLPWRLEAVNRKLAEFGKQPLEIGQLSSGANQLKCLVDLCHLHGIAVILDIVYNHAGGGFDDQSLWFLDRQPVGDANRSLYFTDHGWAGGQVFAYWNDWVSQFLIDNARFFLGEYRIDGYRYDEARVIENNGGRSFCENLTRTVRATNPAAIQIAEYWNPDRASAVRQPPNGLGFDAELGDGLRDALRNLFRQASGGLSASIKFDEVRRAFAARGDIPEPWRLVQCVENHDLTHISHSDAARAATLADPSDPLSWYARSRSRLIACLLLAGPGIPALFMGQEILEHKKWSDNPADDGLIGWERLDDPSSVSRDFLRYMGDLIALRRAEPALRSDFFKLTRADEFGRVLVLHRWLEHEGRDVVIIASLDELPKHGYAVGLPAGGTWRELFNSDLYESFPNYDVVGNHGSIFAAGPPLDGLGCSAAVVLPANGVIVLGVGD